MVESLGSAVVEIIILQLTSLPARGCTPFLSLLSDLVPTKQTIYKKASGMIDTPEHLGRSYDSNI